MGNTALHAYLETADPIDSDTAIALLDIELAEAAQGAAPLSNTFDNSGVSVKSIDQLAAPRAEGPDHDTPIFDENGLPNWRRFSRAVQDDGLDAQTADLIDALAAHNVFSRLDFEMFVDGLLRRAASPLNASGDER